MRTFCTPDARWPTGLKLPTNYKTFISGKLQKNQIQINIFVLNTVEALLNVTPALHMRGPLEFLGRIGEFVQGLCT